VAEERVEKGVEFDGVTKEFICPSSVNSVMSAVDLKISSGS
jgi:hypothetical protein